MINDDLKVDEEMKHRVGEIGKASSLGMQQPNIRDSCGWYSVDRLHIYIAAG